MLSGGVKGVVEMADEAQRLGLVLDDKALKGAEDFNDALTRMRGVLGGVVRRVASQMMPIVTEWVQRVQQWVLANEGLIKQRLEQGMALLGDVLKRVGQVLRWVVDNWQTLKVVLLAIVGGKILMGLIGITSQIASMGGALAAAAGSAGGLGGAVGRVAGTGGKLVAALGKAGHVGMALGVGWTIGKVLDDALGLSDKLSSGLFALQQKLSGARGAREARTARHARGVKAQTLEDKARSLAQLRASGVTSVQGRDGGRTTLDQAGVVELLKRQAKNIGMGGPELARLIPALTRTALASAAAAPAGKAAAGQVTVQPAQISVTVPPGTPATVARRVADAAGTATTTAMRRAMGDVAR